MIILLVMVLMSEIVSDASYSSIKCDQLVMARGIHNQVFSDFDKDNSELHVIITPLDETKGTSFFLSVHGTPTDDTSVNRFTSYTKPLNKNTNVTIPIYQDVKPGEIFVNIDPFVYNVNIKSVSVIMVPKTS